MTDERFSRTRPVLGEEGMDALSRAKVIVFGAGGVGGAAIEALARAGVGTLHVVDADTVSVSNINRQILAADSTVGLSKVEAAKRRVFDIAPSCHFTGHEHFYTPEDRGGIELWDFDYIIDAIDTVKSKLFLIEEATRLSVPIICSMGTGNKTDPTRLKVSDIYKTNTCPLAAVIRRECRKRSIRHLKVIWSDELPCRAVADSEGGRHAPGSVSFVPPVAGMIAAAEAVKQIIKASL